MKHAVFFRYFILDPFTGNLNIRPSVYIINNNDSTLTWFKSKA